jgi:hypothetical protein
MSRCPVFLDGKMLYDKQRLNVLSSLRQNQREKHIMHFCEVPRQRKVMECVTADPASYHFFKQVYTEDLQTADLYTKCD